MHTREEKLAALGRLLDVLDTLREKCPWDRKQTNESLRPNTIEEVYELCEALMDDDGKNICKELGDVLMHVFFYCRIGQERQLFDIADVCHAQCEKLIFRHPHVYGDATANSAGDVLKSWEQLKQREKDGNKTVLSGVPQSLPTLIKAYRIQDKARNVGFDWEQPQDVWLKVKEEIGEYEAELEAMAAAPDARAKAAAKERATDELGDVLFSIINAARLYHLNPDNALERTNRKFIQRFGYVEQQAKAQGIALHDLTLAQMDKLWEEAKAALAGSAPGEGE